jgi:hypothetical protein
LLHVRPVACAKRCKKRHTLKVWWTEPLVNLSLHRLRNSLFLQWYLMILQGPCSKGFNEKPWETSDV